MPWSKCTIVTIPAFRSPQVSTSSPIWTRRKRFQAAALSRAWGISRARIGLIFPASKVSTATVFPSNAINSTSNKRACPPANEKKCGSPALNHSCHGGTSHPHPPNPLRARTCLCVRERCAPVRLCNTSRLSGRNRRSRTDTSSGLVSTDR